MKKSLYDTANDPQTLVRFSAAVRQIPFQTDAAAVTALLSEITALLGCTASVFASFIKSDDDLESYRFMAACPPSWCQLYAERRWFAVDQFLNYARSNTEPILANKIASKTEGQAELAARGREHGFRSSVIVPFHSSAGRVRMGLLYIGSERESYFDDEGFLASKMYLRELAHEIGEWWMRTIRQELLSGVSLSELDTELLRYVHQACSSREIASMTNLSVNTIDQRLARISGRLGVPSRRSAARLAYDLGLFQN